MRFFTRQQADQITLWYLFLLSRFQVHELLALEPFLAVESIKEQSECLETGDAQAGYDSCQSDIASRHGRGPDRTDDRFLRIESGKERNPCQGQ